MTFIICLSLRLRLTWDLFAIRILSLELTAAAPGGLRYFTAAATC
jgi:hypothetical protein